LVFNFMKWNKIGFHVWRMFLNTQFGKLICFLGIHNQLPIYYLSCKQSVNFYNRNIFGNWFVDSLKNILVFQNWCSEHPPHGTNFPFLKFEANEVTLTVNIAVGTNVCNINFPHWLIQDFLIGLLDKRAKDMT